MARVGARPAILPSSRPRLTIEERARLHRERVPHPRPEPVDGRKRGTKGRGEGGVASDMTDKDSSSAKAPTLPDTQRRGGWGTRKSRGEGGVVSFSSTYFLYTYLSARISQCLAGYIATTARTICISLPAVVTSVLSLSAARSTAIFSSASWTGLASDTDSPCLAMWSCRSTSTCS